MRAIHRFKTEEEREEWKQYVEAKRIEKEKEHEEWFARKQVNDRIQQIEIMVKLFGHVDTAWAIKQRDNGATNAEIMRELRRRRIGKQEAEQ